MTRLVALIGGAIVLLALLVWVGYGLLIREPGSPATTTAPAKATPIQPTVFIGIEQKITPPGYTIFDTPPPQQVTPEPSVPAAQATP